MITRGARRRGTASDIDDPAEPVGQAEDELEPVQARDEPDDEQRQVDRRVGERRPLEPSSKVDHGRAARPCGAAARRPRRATAPMSAGHHACASCSASRTTSAPVGQPRLPTNMTSRWGRRTSASQRSRSGSTLHSSRSSRAERVGRRTRRRRPRRRRPSAQRPAHDASHGARRPGEPAALGVAGDAQRGDASRWRRPRRSRSAQRTGCSSRIRPPSLGSWCETRRAATPSWLGEPRSRSAGSPRRRRRSCSAGGS